MHLYVMLRVMWCGAQPVARRDWQVSRARAATYRLVRALRLLCAHVPHFRARPACLFTLLFR